MQYITQPLNHLRPVRRWAELNKARLHLDVADFSLRVAHCERMAILLPKFVIKAGDRLAYTKRFTHDGQFVGWLPYELKRWPLATDKLAFKRFCVQHALPVPATLPAGRPCDRGYILKQRSGSFGRDIEGPFPQGNPVPWLSEEQFAEEFIEGRAAKAWYWGETPVAVEMLEPPHLVGDGVRSVEHLLRDPRGSFDRSYDVEQARPMLAWQGLFPSSVPARGSKVLLGFKYVTGYEPLSFADRDRWASMSPALQARFRQMGAVLVQAIPQGTRPYTLYTVDAVLDGQDRLWLLEMNSNPMIHPAAYGAMLDDLFGTHTPDLRDSEDASPAPAQQPSHTS